MKTEMLVLNKIEGIEPLPTANPFPNPPSYFRMIDVDNKEEMENLGKEMFEHLQKVFKLIP